MFKKVLKQIKQLSRGSSERRHGHYYGGSSSRRHHYYHSESDSSGRHRHHPMSGSKRYKRRSWRSSS